VNRALLISRNVTSENNNKDIVATTQSPDVTRGLNAQTNTPILRSTITPQASAPILTPPASLSTTQTRNTTQTTGQKQKTRRLDKDIKLKNNAYRQHIHRYDLNIKIKKKPKSDDDEENLIIAALQRFHKIMLAADSTTLIPAYLEMDRNDRGQPDLSQDYQVSSVGDFAALKCYYSRLSSRNETTGKVYCSLILAQSLPFAAVVNASLNALMRDEFGLYQRASDHEAPGEIG
jgi:hypothetical protein